jgi:NADPH:quinone reductase-like Zn-dependent oxidoreductase
LDVAIRRGDVNESLPVPFVLGSNFVGVVQQCGSKAKLDYGIEKGTRVTSIIRTGGNARFITLPLNALMVVPKRLDAAEVACIISLYLPCFQALHYGTPRPFRYSQSCLRDKRIFITGASLLEAQTLTWLARYAGAAQVFVSIAKEHFERIISYHAVPVDDDPIALFQTLDGLMMDVMIDYDFPKYLHVAQALLDDEKGRLVCCASPVKIATETEEVSPLCGWPSTLVDCWYSMDYFWEQSTLTLVNGATMFHYFDSWQSNPKGMQVK